MSTLRRPKCRHNFTKLGLKYKKKYRKWVCTECGSIWIEIPLKNYLKIMKLLAKLETSINKK